MCLSLQSSIKLIIDELRRKSFSNSIDIGLDLQIIKIRFKESRTAKQPISYYFGLYMAWFFLSRY